MASIDGKCFMVGICFDDILVVTVFSITYCTIKTILYKLVMLYKNH